MRASTNLQDQCWFTTLDLSRTLQFEVESFGLPCPSCISEKVEIVRRAPSDFRYWPDSDGRKSTQSGPLMVGSSAPEPRRMRVEFRCAAT